MNKYKSLLCSLQLEIDSPYNDGYSQKAYKNQYTNLIKMGEKEFTRELLISKFEDIESKIKELTFELNCVKSKLVELDKK